MIINLYVNEVYFENVIYITRVIPYFDLTV